MENQLRFAIIGVTSLEAIALRRVLTDEIGVHSEFFRDVDDFFPSAERFDAFVVTPEVALFNPDFFMTRKQRVGVCLPSYGSSSAVNPPFLSFSVESDEETVVDILRRLAHSVGSESPEQGALSSREIEVLREVAAGKTNKEIADSLCISINTVITHRRNVSSKLGIRSASGLSLYAMMNGLLNN
ncbi:MAG: response regulator transcription factor [Bacteroidales bacterium]|nr:response regulator transcription factor [Bacteroidales bacterium]